MSATARVQQHLNDPVATLDILSIQEPFMRFPAADVTLELRRILSLFQETGSISEAEFVMNCKNIMNILFYSHPGTLDYSQKVLLVDTVEYAAITFILRVLPLAFQEIIATPPYLHPISPPTIVSLLEIADMHINRHNAFDLQLRMAAIYQLLRDSEGVSLVCSMCQLFPKIQTSAKWRLVNLAEIMAFTSSGRSVSFPELHTSVVSASPTRLSSSLVNSTTPSLSSLLEGSPSWPTSYLDIQASDLVKASNSEPAVSCTYKDARSVISSSSAPNLTVPEIIDAQNLDAVSTTYWTETSNGDFPSGLGIALEEPLLSTSLFDPEQEEYNMGISLHTEDSSVSDLTDIASRVLPIENPQPLAHQYPQGISTAQDCLRGFGSYSDLEGPPPSPFFDADIDTLKVNFFGNDSFSISIESPLSGRDSDPPNMNVVDLISPLPIATVTHDPLSSPRIVVQKDTDNFRNTFEIEVQGQALSPRNKRLRSASNCIQPVMRRVYPTRRIASASSKLEKPLDSELLATLTLPAPPKSNHTQNSPLRKKCRGLVNKEGNPRAISEGEGSIVMGDKREGVRSRQRWQNGRRKSGDKENT